MAYDLKDKKILIIGGSSGIGFATAQAALDLGALVTIASHDETKLKDAASKMRGYVAVYVVDTLRNDSVVQMFAQFGPADHIIVSASSTKGGSVRALSLEDAYASMDSKFWGAYRIAKAASLNEGGSLTLVSGFLSQRPSASSVLQGAINAALEGLMRGLALEFAPMRGLALEFAPMRVNVVSPGLIDTPLYSKMSAENRDAMMADAKKKLPVHRVGAAEDIAQAILFLASNAFTTGSVVTVDGGGTIA